MDHINRFFSTNQSLNLDPGDLYDFRNSTIFKDTEPGVTILNPGDDCLYLPFVISGDLKVHKTAENGREIVLYHIKKDQSCILSALGILNNSVFPASAVSSGRTTVLLVPDRLVRRFIEKYPGWRNYIFTLYNDRFHGVLEIIDEILFRKIDVRLARFLINRVKDKDVLKNHTHQSLAEELGSSREVISRVMKSLSDREIIAYQRNEIRIRDRKALEKISSLH